MLNNIGMSLGHGLESLIPKKSEGEGLSSPQIARPREPQKEAVFHIEVEKIKPNPYQPRREHSEEGIIELASSIREVGIIQPLVVSKIEKESETGTIVEYQLIAGERRLKAAKFAGLARVPVIIRRTEVPRENLSVALIENIQRENLNPIETAKAYARLQDEFGLTQREVATRVSKSRESIANTLRLLNLPSHIQNALAQGKLNESQGRYLLTIKDPQEQERVFNQILTRGVGPKRVRARAKSKTPPNPEEAREINFWQKQLEERIGAPVRLVKNEGKGKIVIEFYSHDEWQNLLNRLLEK